MRNNLLTFIFLGVLISACTNNNTPAAPQADVPKALEQSDSYYLSKRTPDDLVNALYIELKVNTPSLKKLDEEIETINQAIPNSLSAFTQYNQKVQSYYQSATNHINQLGDSVLKQRIRVQISKSLDNYTANSSAHKALVDAIGSKQVSLQDLHNVLKVVKTMAVMEKYQKENLPEAKPMKAVLQHVEQTIGHTSSLIKE